MYVGVFMLVQHWGQPSEGDWLNYGICSQWNVMGPLKMMETWPVLGQVNNGGYTHYCVCPKW